jgi:hypothetical protein
MTWNLKGLLHERAIYRSRTLTKLRVVELPVNPALLLR